MMTRSANARGLRLVIAAAAALGMASSAAPADEQGARALDALRGAYTSAPVAERFTVEVHSQDQTAQRAEGVLRLDLRPRVGVNLDLTLGPVHAWFGHAIQQARFVVTHAADKERYVGLGVPTLTWADLQGVLPSLPLPQLALCLDDPGDDTLDLSPLAPPITMNLLARTERAVTLSGQGSGAIITLVLDPGTSRLQRFDATIPAASGWYDLLVTVEPLDQPSMPDCGPSVPGPLCPPDLAGRRRVDRVSDLRPRGLVLVPGADTAWIPAALRGHDETWLADVLSSDGPTVVVFAEVGVDDSWREKVENLLAVAPAAPADRTLLLLFDPSGTASETRPPAESVADQIARPHTLVWVDARALPLRHALPRIDAGVLVIGPDALIRAVVPIERKDEPGGVEALLRAMQPPATSPSAPTPERSGR